MPPRGSSGTDANAIHSFGSVGIAKINTIEVIKETGEITLEYED